MTDSEAGSETGSEAGPEGGRPAETADRDDDPPVLPAGSQDEQDVGWGDDPAAARRGREFYDAERPPHHE